MDYPRKGFGKLVQLAYLVPDVDTGMAEWSKHAGVGPWTCFRNIALPSTYMGQELDLQIHEALSYIGELQIQLVQSLNDPQTPTPYSEYRRQNKRLSGFGHRLHTDDPRTKKLFKLAGEYGFTEKYVPLARTLEEEMEKTFQKKLPLNVDGAIATLLCEMDFDPILANAFFIIARVPGLAAHIYEEKTRYKPMRQIHPTDVEYDGPADRTI